MCPRPWRGCKLRKHLVILIENRAGSNFPTMREDLLEEALSKSAVNYVIQMASKATFKQI